LIEFREPFNGISHLVAALFAVGGLIWLLIMGWDNPVKRVSLLVYGLSLVLMFASSSAYHSTDARPNIMLHLKKFDHTSIYLMIAGSYTPVCLHFFEGFWCWPFLGIIWGLATAGAVVKLFLIHTPRWVTAGLYLTLGWLSIVAFPMILHTLTLGALLWLVSGGLFFTIGAMVYIFKKPDLFPGRFGFHELWHIFVILGAFSHFMLVARHIAPIPS
jgi:hemolysin III